MKTVFQLLAIFFIAVAFNACKSSGSVADSHSSQNSLDWAGMYRSAITDGSGKEKVSILHLENNLAYMMQTSVAYDPTSVTTSTGTFSWNKSGNEITLNDKSTGSKTTFIVKENMLTGKSGELTMKKISTNEITNNYWKLIEINGKPVVKTENMGREPHMILKSDNRYTAYAGCNNILGGFELGNMNRIKFLQGASTMMACPDMELEKNFLEVLQKVDNFTVSADGKTLSLNKARMAPLARFEVVYLR